MELIDGERATPADLRALAFATLGHFTTMRAESGGVRGLALHLDRLRADCRALFDVELDTDLAREHVRLALADEPDTVIVRVTLFDPALTLERPGADASPRILVSPRAASSGAAPPLRVRSVRFARQTAEIKHIGMFAALHQRRLAQRAGFDDAVFVDAAGHLAEGPTWNLGVIKSGEVVWADGDALPGVTRALLGGPSGTVALGDVPDLDAAFVTSSGTGIRAVTAIDGHVLPAEHPRFAELRTAYASVPLDQI